jgi:putative alpha-1,2-mannosidase
MDYIQKATINGNELKDFWFEHEAFRKGGTLELWMGDKPNKSWGTKDLPDL